MHQAYQQLAPAFVLAKFCRREALRGYPLPMRYPVRPTVSVSRSSTRLCGYENPGNEQRRELAGCQMSTFALGGADSKLSRLRRMNGDDVQELHGRSNRGPWLERLNRPRDAHWPSKPGVAGSSPAGREPARFASGSRARSNFLFY